jgi:hypothetical protein
MRGRGNDRLEQRQPFGAELGGERRQAREVAARPGEAGDEPRPDGITPEPHDDRHGGGGLLGGADCRIPRRHDDGHLPLHQVGREGREPLVHPPRIALLHGEMVPVAIPEVVQALQEAVAQGGGACGRREQPNPGERRLRLRIGHERRPEEAEGEDDEESHQVAWHRGVLQQVLGASRGG